MKAIITISLKDGVLDPTSHAIQNSLTHLGINYIKALKISRQIEVTLATDDKAKALELATKMCTSLLANPVMETYHIDISG